MPSAQPVAAPVSLPQPGRAAGVCCAQRRKCRERPPTLQSACVLPVAAPSSCEEGRATDIQAAAQFQMQQRGDRRGMGAQAGRRVADMTWRRSRMVHVSAGCGIHVEKGTGGSCRAAWVLEDSLPRRRWHFILRREWLATHQQERRAGNSLAVFTCSSGRASMCSGVGCVQNRARMQDRARAPCRHSST